ncbi:MAG: response regulator [Candidatus Omnitrophica bacterium]|nr:response regulator [Candidatus Omnitrophota bacterium]
MIFNEEYGDMSLEIKQVFIIDDDESVCRALSILLLTFGFAVRTFSSAISFFQAVSNDVPGCLLIDIHMPGIDGWTAQKQLVESGSKRPVIFISAEKPDIAIERAFKVGAVGFLKKPVDGQVLVDLINSACEDALLVSA